MGTFRKAGCRATESLLSSDPSPQKPQGNRGEPGLSAEDTSVTLGHLPGATPSPPTGGVHVRDTPTACGQRTLALPSSSHSLPSQQSARRTPDPPEATRTAHVEMASGHSNCHLPRFRVAHSSPSYDLGPGAHSEGYAATTTSSGTSPLPQEPPSLSAVTPSRDQGPAPHGHPAQVQGPGHARSTAHVCAGHCSARGPAAEDAFPLPGSWSRTGVQPAPRGARAEPRAGTGRSKPGCRCGRLQNHYFPGGTLVPLSCVYGRSPAGSCLLAQATGSSTQR